MTEVLNRIATMSKDELIEYRDIVATSNGDVESKGVVIDAINSRLFPQTEAALVEPSEDIQLD